MSIKINLNNSLKYKATNESGQESTIQLQHQEQQTPTIEKAQSKLSKFIDGIRSNAKDKLSQNKSDRFDANYKKGIEAHSDTESYSTLMADLKERTRNPIAVGVEKGKAYLNATAEVGAKNATELAKNDISQTKEDLKNLFQKGAEVYMASQSFMRKDIAKTKEDVNSVIQKGSESFMAGQSFMRKDVAQTKENFDKNVKSGLEAGKMTVEATVGAVVQMGEGAKVLNKMAAEGLDKSREKGYQAIKWLGGKGREAWGGLKSMKDTLVQTGKDKLDSTKKSIAKKVIQKAMQMGGIEAQVTSENSAASSPKVEEIATSFTPEDSADLRLRTELSATMLKYNSPIIRRINQTINKIDFADPTAGQQVFNSLKDLYETGIVSPDDFNKIRNTVNELMQ
jgi:hypothetical protein